MPKLPTPASTGVPAPARRAFLQSCVGGAGALLAAGLAASPRAQAAAAPLAVSGKGQPFKISLAEWSLHNALRAGQLDNLDFPLTANRLGFDGVEYVNQFFNDKAKDRKYLAELKRRAAGEGVWNVLIMVDREGDLGAPEEARRKQTIVDHQKWLEAAAFLGCHAIRVNARSEGTFDEQAKLAADGLRRLSELGDQHGLHVLVENHGGLSSNGQWLAKVMTLADHPRCGTLPDFGNFKIKEGETYDRYKGVAELMPFARAVSAKSHDFDKKGNEINTDYLRMMKIVVGAGYRGYVGVEYEGKVLPELEGILATKKLLERVRTRLAG